MWGRYILIIIENTSSSKWEDIFHLLKKQILEIKSFSLPKNDFHNYYSYKRWKWNEVYINKEAIQYTFRRLEWMELTWRARKNSRYKVKISWSFLFNRFFFNILIFWYLSWKKISLNRCQVLFIFLHTCLFSSSNLYYIATGIAWNWKWRKTEDE